MAQDGKITNKELLENDLLKPLHDGLDKAHTKSELLLAGFRELVVVSKELTNTAPLKTSGDIAAQTKAINEGNAAAKAYQQTVKTMAAQQKKDIAEAEAAVKKKADTEAKAAKENKKNADDKSKADAKAIKDAENLAKAQAKNQAATENAARSYVLLEKQYNQAAKASQDFQTKSILSGKALTSTQKAIIEETQRLDRVLKQVDGTIGRNQRNVGNYASGFSGLNNSVNQLSRELPALAINANTFFLAISNNLPIFFDEIGKIKAANLELAAEGKATQSVFKSVAGALFSWGTALSIGVALLTLYGGAITKWIGELFTVEKALNAATYAQQRFANALRGGLKETVDEITYLHAIQLALEDKNTTQERSLVLQKKLEELYPTFFKNTDKEILTTEQLKKRLEELNAVLLARNTGKSASKEQAKEDEKMLANTLAIGIARENLLRLNDKLAKQATTFNDLKATPKTGNSQVDDYTDVRAQFAGKALVNTYSEIEKLNKLISDLEEKDSKSGQAKYKLNRLVIEGIEAEAKLKKEEGKEAKYNFDITLEQFKHEERHRKEITKFNATVENENKKIQDRKAAALKSDVVSEHLGNIQLIRLRANLRLIQQTSAIRNDDDRAEIAKRTEISALEKQIADDRLQRQKQFTDLNILDFELRIAAIKTLTKDETEAVTLKINNEKLSIAARRAAIIELAKLNSDSLAKQKAALRDSFGVNIGPVDFNNPEIIKQLRKIEEEFQTTKEFIEKTDNQLTLLRIENIKRIRAELRQLNAETIASIKIDPDSDKAQAFIENRIKLEAKMANEIALIRHEANVKKIIEERELLVIEGGFNAQNLENFRLAQEKITKEGLRFSDEKRKIKITEIRNEFSRQERIDQIAETKRETEIFKTVKNEKTRAKLIDDEREKALVGQIEQDKIELQRLEAQADETLDIERKIADEEQKLAELRENRRKNKDKKLIQSLIDIGNLVSQELQRRADLENKQIENSISAREKEIEQQTALAAAGKANQLGFEKSELAKEQLVQKEALERQAKQQEIVRLAEAFLTLLNTHLSNGDNYGIASIKALGEVGLAKGIVQTFFAYEGTEGNKTVAETFGKPQYAGKDGYAMRVDGDERIFNPEDTAALGNLTNKELARLAMDYQNGRLLPEYAMGLPTKQGNSFAENIGNSLLVAEIKVLKTEHGKLLKQIADKPEHGFDADRFGNIIETRIARGLTIRETKYRQPKPL